MKRNEDEILSALKAEYAAMKKKFTARKARAEKAPRQEWADGPVYELEPLRTLIAGIKPGKLLSAPPKSTNGKYRYCFDADGLLIGVGEGLKPKDAFNWDFQERDGDDALKGWRYDNGPDPISANLRLLEDGKVVAAYAWTDMAYVIHDYVYEGDRPVLIRMRNKQHREAAVSQWERRLTWSKSGELKTAVDHYPSGKVVQRYPG